ncbi:FUSC family protein [Planosporangium sp. 12N6]|uniref:FUSC family protein n=1 Tax=Planosporangium spinosum TaxID=3402278 RepID=UPI003CF4CCA3
MSVPRYRPDPSPRTSLPRRTTGALRALSRVRALSPVRAVRRTSTGVRATAIAIRAAAPARVRVAVRAMLSMTLPLAIGVAIGHPGWGALASVGGFAGFYGADLPYRYRGRLVAGIGVGITLGVLLGALTSTRGWLAAPVAGVVAAVASLLCQAAEVPPPREYFIVLATLSATGIPVDARQAVLHTGLTAVGAAIGWLVSMSPAIGRYRAPEHRAVRAALDAVATLLARTGRPDAGLARHTAVTAVRRARRAAMQGALPADHRLTRTVTAVEDLLEAALHVQSEASAPLDPRWAAAVRSLAPVVTGGTVPDRPLPEPGATVGDAPLRDAVRKVRAALGGADTARGEELAGLPAWPGILPQVRAAARWQSVILPAAVRLGVAVAVGAGIGRALGLANSYWVGLTAAAVLLASNSAGTVRRSVHRVAGSVAGVALAYALLAGHPPWVAIVAGIAVFQFIAEMTITASYGIAVVGITVLALVLFHIGSPGGDVNAMIGARLSDTVLGAALALALRAVLWPRATAARLPQVQARTLRSVDRVLAALWLADRQDRVGHGGDGDGLADERRQLQTHLVTLRAIHTDALADDRSATPDTDLRWPVTVAIEELAFLALSLPRSRPVPPAGLARTFRDGLGRISVAVDGYTPAPAGAPPKLPGYPRTSAAVSTLATAVADAGTAGRREAAGSPAS